MPIWCASFVTSVVSSSSTSSIRKPCHRGVSQNFPHSHALRKPNVSSAIIWTIVHYVLLYASTPSIVLTVTITFDTLTCE
ncbi:hypothetical protein BD410DRAFT_781938 [Rickenella mellea]|uniref:Uncharacterized protein n=1 Tax=Rickenella mellea TaxID=50990 RepID=A0A4Y7QL76_9AGAM|nr:hypothetical protein BD410DRAFT_781938 [Rickenella mellea]